MADTAKDLFLEFKREGVERIDRCITERQGETLYLDFKQSIDAENRPTGDLTRDGKKLLSENMSAFANSGGGVLVWGVRDSGHCADKKIPIPNVEGFVTQLQRATQQAVSPPLEGVEHVAIVECDGAGYAVTYVPDGRAKPYMAVQYTEQYTYFLRVGDSTKPMPDAAVRAFVVASARPSLTVYPNVNSPGRFLQGEISNIPENSRPHRVKTSISFKVVNDGTALAERPAIALEVLPNVTFGSYNGMVGTVIEQEGTKYDVNLYRLDHSDPIYPGTHLRLGNIEVVIEATQMKKEWFSIHDFNIRYWVFARNLSSTGVITIPRSELTALMP